MSTAAVDEALVERAAQALVEHPSIPANLIETLFYCPTCGADDDQIAGPNSPTHATHQARAVLAAVLPDVEARAEQRGREDNADHGMCYVHGSAALAEHDADVRRQVAEDIAATINDRRLGAPPSWQHGLQEAIRIAREVAHPRSP